MMYIGLTLPVPYVRDGVYDDGTEVNLRLKQAQMAAICRIGKTYKVVMKSVHDVALTIDFVSWCVLGGDYLVRSG